MVTREIDQSYLEHPVGVSLVHLEAFDGYGQPRVFSIAHVCKPGMVMDLPDAYKLPPENVGGGYDAVGFTDLGEKQ